MPGISLRQACALIDGALTKADGIGVAMNVAEAGVAAHQRRQVR